MVHYLQLLFTKYQNLMQLLFKGGIYCINFTLSSGNYSLYQIVFRITLLLSAQFEGTLDLV